MLDQVIFAFMDWLMGYLADRWALVIGRVSRIVAVITAVSCVAFLLLQFIAPMGSEALFLALTILWSASTSALRALPLALLGKYASRDAVPWLASLSMFSLGVGDALAPYLTITPRWNVLNRQSPASRYCGTRTAAQDCLVKTLAV